MILSGIGCWPEAWGQARADEAYKDPDYIQLPNSSAIRQAAYPALYPVERAAVCRIRRGSITYECQLDPQGRTTNISVVELHYAARKLSAPVLATMKARIRRDLVFYVPPELQPLQRQPDRYSRIGFPLTIFCP